VNKPAPSRSQGAAASPAVAGFAPATLTLAVAAAFLGSPAAQAQPSGAQAIHGQASLSQQGSNLRVTTQNGAGTNHSAINWQSFSVPGGSTTHFQQPTAASLSINRVVGNDPSAIFGTLSSNGRLVLVNPAGIAVGAGAMVDTAGFTASTLRLSEANAIAGRLLFGGDGLASGALSVDGTLRASGGDVVLIAPNVQVGSPAIVQSPNGATILAAGQKVELTGRGLEGIRLELQAPSDQALNLGTLQGDAVGIFAGQLKHSGLIHATATSIEGGKVVLKGVGSADIAGRVTARKGEQGGQVHATAGKVMLRSGAVIDVSGAQGGGEVLIGGGWQGKDSRIANAQTTTVETGVTIQANATNTGNGGTVVVWSDDVTRVGAQIEAKGGPHGGDGGSVETSGKGTLVFRATVDTSAPQGKAGSILLDPRDIIIADGLGGADDGLLADKIVGAVEPNATTDITISEQTLEGLAGNVTLQASRDVILSNLSDGVLDLTGVTGGSTFAITAGRDILSVGPIGDVNDRFQTAGGAITMAATGNINIGGVRSRGGAVDLSAGGNLVVREILTTPTSLGSGGAINLTSGGFMSLGGGHIDARFNGSGTSGNVVMAASGPIYMQASKTVYANTLKMSAVGGIGDGGTGALAFDAAQVSAGNSGSGDVKLSFTGAGGVAVTDLGFGFGLQNSASGGAIALATTQSPLTVSSAVTASGSITLTGTAGPSAPPGTAATKIGSGATISSTGGSVTLGGTFNNPSALSGTGLLVEGLVQSGPAGQITLIGSATVGGGAGTGVDIASTAVLTAGSGGLTVSSSVSSSTTATALVSTRFSGSASSSGNIAITGTANAPSASGVTGVMLDGSVMASGAATITITGSGVPAPAPASSYDVQLAGITVGSGGGEIKLVGDRMNIGSPINSGTGRTMIVPFTANRPITLGGSSEAVGLNLSAAELNLITASTIVVGGSSYNGGITIGNLGGAINPVGASALSLINGAGGSITQTAALTVSNLNADAGTVTLTNAGNQVDQISGRSTTGAFQFTNSKAALTVGTVDGIAGINSGAFSTVLNNASGALAQTQAVLAATLTASSASGMNLSHSGNQIGAFTATNTSSGDVVLRNGVATTLSNVANTGPGRIDIQNTGNVTIASGAVSSGGTAAGSTASTAAVSVVSTGGILASGGGIHITNSGGGTVYLQADNGSIGASTTSRLGLSIPQGVIATAAGTGADVNLAAGAGTNILDYISAPGDIDIQSAAGQLIVADTIVSTGGDVKLSAYGGIVVQPDTATDATITAAGAVNLTATMGGISLLATPSAGVKVMGQSSGTACAVGQSLCVSTPGNVVLTANGSHAALLKSAAGDMSVNGADLLLTAGSTSDAVLLAPAGNIVAVPAPCTATTCPPLAYGMDPLANSTAQTGLLAANYYTKVLAGADAGTLPSSGGTIDLLANDAIEVAFGGAPGTTPATPALVTISMASPPPGVSVSGGDLVAASSVAPGTYNLAYTSCAVADPANCTTGTISLTVAAAPAPAPTPPAPAPAPILTPASDGSRIDQVVELLGGGSRSVAVAALAELDASAVKPVGEGSNGLDNIVDDNQCRR
jgi:filamentous hemagglutinin family protein